MPVTPDYAGPQITPPPSPLLYRLALFFTIAPLVAGLSILILYVLTESNQWIAMGLVMLVAGTLSVIMALVLIGVYGTMGRRCVEGVAPMIRSRVKRVVQLAALNFVAAFGCAAFGMWYSSQVWMTQTIVVTNAGKTPVASAVINVAGTHAEIGPIDPGATIRRKLKISNSGGVTYDMVINGQHVAGTADAYVTEGSPGTHRITVKDGPLVTSP